MFSESFIGLMFDMPGQRSWDPQLQERDAGFTTGRRKEMRRDLCLEQIGVMFIDVGTKPEGHSWNTLFHGSRGF